MVDKQNETTLVSEGVDYITCYFESRRPNNGLGALLNALGDWEVKGGNIIKPWGMSGFKGWYVGGFQTGTRGEECLVRLSSETARLFWRQIYEMADNTSRIDCQCTTRNASSARKRIAGHIREAKRAATNGTTKAGWRYIENSTGALTLYSGSRQSEYLGRVYDKGLESGEERFRECVRAEVQANGKAAGRVSRHLAQIKLEPGWISRWVSGWFWTRGVQLPITADHHHYGGARPRSDLDKMLQWFATQCRLSAQTLVAHGKAEEMMEALGLTIVNGRVESRAVGPRGPLKDEEVT